MKKKIILVFMLVIVAVLGYLFLNKRATNNVSNESILPPSIPNQALGVLPAIKFDVKSSDFNFPSSLPFLQIQTGQPLTLQDAKKIANGFGFIDNPVTAQDATAGETYIWNGDKDSLVVYSKTRQIDYSLNAISKVTNKQLSDKNISSTAQGFLGKSLGNDFNKIFLSGFLYLDLTSEKSVPTTKQLANVYQVNFSPIQLNYKLLSINPQQAPINVWVLPDGTIARAHVVLTGEIAKSDTSYQIKNYLQVKNSLSRAILINLDNGNLNIGNVKTSDIYNLDVKTVEIAYLFESNSNFYQPIFLLTGTADINGYGNGLSVQLYLPSLANQ